MCGGCLGGRCVDAPTRDLPAAIECTLCGGFGCGVCQDGKITIDRCPFQIVPESLWLTLRFVNFAEKGVWPVSGGLLDQCAAFVSACEVVRADDASWQKSKVRKRDG